MEMNKKMSGCSGGVHVRSTSALFVSISFVFFSLYLVSAQPRNCSSLGLKPAEVRALKEIGSILGKKNWNFTVNPCSGKSGWVDDKPQKGFENDVQCILAETNTSCHVTSIDLTRNYLNGTIPKEWASLRIVHLRISDNAFSGKISEFIGKWPNLKILEIQGTNLLGPIPSGISNLAKLEKLVISGISGTSSNFPAISKMISLKTLVLRNCMLSGQIPKDIGALKSLKLLDLSFNNLTGEMPQSLGDVRKLQFLFLTNNNLTGSLEDAKLRNGLLGGDFSYNNFTNTPRDASTSCVPKSPNLVKSVKAWEKENVIHPCLRGSCKKPKYLSFHVNCGSQSSVTLGKTTFEGDDAINEAAVFYAKSDNDWALSSTGTFLDNDDPADKYTVEGKPQFVPPQEAALYSAARISPISLKYYGLCLYNGPYTVKLYFAEIVITNDKNFSSLGNRIFDVYIQGKLEKKDFNIKRAAGMSGKEVVLNFTKVNVTNNELEIHFFWDGKGTTGIPERGVYGPLVSAISVEAGRPLLFIMVSFLHVTYCIIILLGPNLLTRSLRWIKPLVP